MLKCYKFTEYFRLTEALSLNLPPNAYTEIFVHGRKATKKPLKLAILVVFDLNKVSSLGYLDSNQE